MNTLKQTLFQRVCYDWIDLFHGNCQKHLLVLHVRYLNVKIILLRRSDEMGDLILQQWLSQCHHYDGKLDASRNGVFYGRISSSIKQAIVENGSEKLSHRSKCVLLVNLTAHDLGRCRLWKTILCRSFALRYLRIP